MTIEPWKNVVVPTVFLPDLNHSDILRKPNVALVRMVFEALAVSSSNDYEAWTRKHRAASRAALDAKKTTRWQQFVVHAIDERGDGIADYFLEVGTVANRKFKRLDAFDMDVHAFREDESYRCFHVDLDRLQPEKLMPLALRVIASSGTELVAYRGHHSAEDLVLPPRERNKWDAVIEFDASIGSKEVQFFFPYTTTLIEVRMNREPMPLVGVNRVFWFTTGA